MTIIFDSAVSVNSARPFGRGIAHRSSGPSQADLDWAAQLFGELEDARLPDEQDRELEARAFQYECAGRFAYARLDSCDFPQTSECRACGELDFTDFRDLCPSCSDRCVVWGVHGETDENAMRCRCSLAAIEGSTTNRPRSF